MCRFAVNIALFSVLVMGIFSVKADAQMLGSVNINLGYGSYGNGTFPFVPVGLYYNLFPPTSGPTFQYFDLNISVQDIGKKFDLTYGSYFDSAVYCLTNGLDDQMDFLMNGFGYGVTESNVFSSLGLRYIDFYGYGIDRISYKVDNFSILTQDFGQGGNWTDYSLFSTLSFYGTSPVSDPIPEPSTFLLFGAGLGGLTLIRRRKF